MTGRGMVRRFVITGHALSRYAERHPELSVAASGETWRMLSAELDQGVPFGYQKGRDELYLLPSGLVAAVCWDEGVGIVKTVLVKDHAIAGMESHGCGAEARESPEAAGKGFSGRWERARPAAGREYAPARREASE